MCKKGHHPQNVQRPIPNHSEDMPEGTLRAILKQAGIAPEEFLSL
ncbi:MAG: type II toxin-antitoxin system HicA family toxin [Hormoscilla sp. SP12CHS1]|nr:type II toxin-antitoxin system HicA family toxin [Hormoscilla sp. SP12CHS1]